MNDLTDIGRSLANVMTATERQAELNRLIAEARKACQLGTLKRYDAAEWVAGQMESDWLWAYEQTWAKIESDNELTRALQRPTFFRREGPEYQDPWEALETQAEAEPANDPIIQSVTPILPDPPIHGEHIAEAAALESEATTIIAKPDTFRWQPPYKPRPTWIALAVRRFWHWQERLADELEDRIDNLFEETTP